MSDTPSSETAPEDPKAVQIKQEQPFAAVRAPMSAARTLRQSASYPASARSPSTRWSPPLDQPDQRGAELLAALDYLVQTSSVRTRIDGTRLDVMGHSVGGGGSLRAATTRPAIQAAIPLTPWHS